MSCFIPKCSGLRERLGFLSWFCGLTGLSGTVLAWEPGSSSRSLSAAGLVMLNMPSALMCPCMPQPGWLLQLRMGGISSKGPVPRLAWASTQHNSIWLVGLLPMSQLAQKACSGGLEGAARLPVTWPWSLHPHIHWILLDKSKSSGQCRIRSGLGQSGDQQAGLAGRHWDSLFYTVSLLVFWRMDIESLFIFFCNIAYHLHKSCIHI